MGIEWLIGDRLAGRYEVSRILKGGLGVVYVVCDDERNTVYAAKTFQDEIFARDSLSSGRFIQEARAWVNLDRHPNVVHAEFVQTILGKPYLFLEYVSGGDLAGKIGRPQLTLTRALQLAGQFCDGMIHIMARGILAHRDVKPANCLVEDDWTLKITDFGLAKVLNPIDSESVSSEGSTTRPAVPGQTGTGLAWGTVTHMAPEQFDDVKRVDVRADIYSFGVMLFQMVTGRLPFVAREPEEFRALHKTAKPPSLRHHPAARLDGLIQKCLSKDPAERFSDFSELRDAVARAYTDITGLRALPLPASVNLDVADLTSKGIGLAALGRSRQALPYLSEALTLAPLNTTVWVNMGTALNRLGRANEAFTCYEKAIGIDFQCSLAWFNRGVALRERGQPEEALASYDRALSADPLFSECWMNKASLLGASGRPHDALDCINHALKLNPMDALAWHTKGGCLSEIGRPADSIQCYLRSLELEPRAETCLQMGRDLRSLGRLSESLAAFDRGLSLNPDDKGLWLGRARTLHASDDLAEALLSVDRALSIDSAFGPAWSCRGLVLLASGDEEGARSCIARAASLGDYEGGPQLQGKPALPSWS